MGVTPNSPGEFGGCSALPECRFNQVFLERFDGTDIALVLRAGFALPVVLLGGGAVKLSAFKDLQTAAAEISALEEAIVILRVMAESRVAFGREGLLDGDSLADIRGEAFCFLSWLVKKR